MGRKRAKPEPLDRIDFYVGAGTPGGPGPAVEKTGSRERHSIVMRRTDLLRQNRRGKIKQTDNGHHKQGDGSFQRETSREGMSTDQGKARLGRRFALAFCNRVSSLPRRSSEARQQHGCHRNCGQACSIKRGTTLYTTL